MFLYHFGAAFLPAAFMTGWGLWLFGTRLAARGRVVPVVVLACYAILGFHKQLIFACLYLETRITERVTGIEAPSTIRGLRNRAEWEALALGIAERFDLKGGALMVWGWDAPFLYHEGRAQFVPATRLVLSTHLRLLPDNTRLHRVMLSDLAATRPGVILVQGDDKDFALAPGLLASDRYLAESFSGFRDLIARDYRQVADFEGYAVYERRIAGDDPA